MDYRFNLSNVPFYLVFIADLFILLGIILIFGVSKENSYASAIIEISKNQKVINTGSYKIVRHLMYIGNIIILLSTPIALGSYSPKKIIRKDYPTTIVVRRNYQELLDEFI